MKIISKRNRETFTEYRLVYRNSEGSGFAFPCTQQGVRIPNPHADENYNFCISSQTEFEFQGIEVSSWSYINPAVGKCDCGNKVALDSFTNTCSRCGADYNMSGQLLAPRSQWGAETGESASDILNYDYETCPDLDY